VGVGGALTGMAMANGSLNWLPDGSKVSTCRISTPPGVAGVAGPDAPGAWGTSGWLYQSQISMPVVVNPANTENGSGLLLVRAWRKIDLVGEWVQCDGERNHHAGIHFLEVGRHLRDVLAGVADLARCKPVLS